MDKPILYCDCDGVILNTIQVAFSIMREHGCNLGNRQEVDAFFRNYIDWKEIFNRAEIINDAINQLRYIRKSGLFGDVMILSKLSGGYDEERLKRALFAKTLPMVRVITLQYGLNKGSVVNASGNILVDDEIGNCEMWRKENGTAILFSPYMTCVENDIISNLSQLKYTDGVKKLIKTRKF